MQEKQIFSTKSSLMILVWLLQSKRTVAFVLCHNKLMEMCHQCQLRWSAKEENLQQKGDGNATNCIWSFTFVRQCKSWAAFCTGALSTHLLTELQWKMSPIFWWMEEIECCGAHTHLPSKMMCCSFLAIQSSAAMQVHNDDDCLQWQMITWIWLWWQTHNSRRTHFWIKNSQCSEFKNVVHEVCHLQWIRKFWWMNANSTDCGATWTMCIVDQSGDSASKKLF